MGLFDKIKNLISRKKEVVEEVKDEYEVEDLDEIEEEPKEDLDIDDDGKDDFEEDDFGDEESEDEEETEPEEKDLDIDDDGEDDFEEEDFDEEESEDEEDEEDEEWAQFVKEHQNKSKVEEAKEIELYDKGLEKTRKEFVSKLSMLGVKYTKISEDYYDELEEILINADVGVNTVMNFMDRLRDRVKKEKITDVEYLNEVIVDELFIIYVEGESLSDKIKIAEEGPTVILMVGVNGVGKTTSIAKIGNKLKKDGKKVMLVAGDTFRAGAVDQLSIWADRIGVDFFGDDRKDPSAVIYDGLTKAKDEKYDVVLVDTAGRLQNKSNLMGELEKMNRVINEILPGNPIETLLVIDATTGQNGISQAKSFKEITNITGIILTKLDGTAKGGIVLAIKELVDIPVKFVGLGEKENDMIPFDIEKYIYGLFKEF